MNRYNHEKDLESRRLFILNIPFDDQIKEGLKNYNLNTYHRIENRHIALIVETNHLQKCLIAVKRIEINGTNYETARFLPMPFQSNNCEASGGLKPNYRHNKNFYKPLTAPESSSIVRRKKSCGRGILKGWEIMDTEDDQEANFSRNFSNLSLTLDENNNNLELPKIHKHDYIRRMERLIPNFFSTIQAEPITDVSEKRRLAKNVIFEYPSLFEERTGEQLRTCPFPDMSFQDEVIRLQEECITRSIRPKPKNPRALRMSWTPEEEEELTKIRAPPQERKPISYQYYPPGTLVKPSDLPMMISNESLLRQKEKLEKELKAFDEADRIFCQQETQREAEAVLRREALIKELGSMSPF
jgi:hypothetical protein